MDQLTAVFAVLGETYFKLRMTQDEIETQKEIVETTLRTAQEEKSVLIHDIEELRNFIDQKVAEEEAAAKKQRKRKKASDA